ncbi:MAG: response regulator [Planctomycetota bacterium]|nr:response regulator [Planctomycetota bacterium]
MAKRVLVVDDEEDLRFLVRTMLKKNGYEVEEAEDGEEALKKLSTQKFDLMVLDIMMPKLDGWGVLKELQKRKMNISVVVLTAKSDDSSAWESYKQGATLYIPKPFDNKMLLNAVNYFIGDISDEERARIEKSL